MLNNSAYVDTIIDNQTQSNKQNQYLEKVLKQVAQQSCNNIHHSVQHN